MREQIQAPGRYMVGFYRVLSECTLRQPIPLAIKLVFG